MQNIYRDLIEISEISLRSRHDVCEFLNLGEIMATFPASCQDRRDLAEIAKTSPRLPRSHHDASGFLNLAVMFESQ